MMHVSSAQAMQVAAQALLASMAATVRRARAALTAANVDRAWAASTVATVHQA